MRSWEKMRLGDEKGFISISLVVICSVISILVSCLYLMGHEESRIVSETAVIDNLRLVGEECLEEEIIKIQSAGVDDGIMQMVKEDRLLEHMDVGKAQCDIYGRKIDDYLILMAAVSDGTYRNRLYVKLKKTNDTYVPAIWEY